jgi:predicted transcriptional regulator
VFALYDSGMRRPEKFEFETPIPVTDDEDTLSAIDEGIRDADAGRTIPSEDVRKLMSKWISDSSTRKRH